MEKDNRSGLAVLLAASTIFLSSSVALFFMRQMEIEKRVAVEKRLDEVNEEKARLTKDLDEALALKSDLEVKLGGVEEKAKLLEGQLQEEKKSREATYLQLEGEKKESKRLVDELMKVKGEKEAISLGLANAKNECETLKAQLSNIQVAKEVLENKLQEVLSKKEVELEKIVVNPDAQQAPQDAAAMAVQEETQEASDSSDKVKGEILVVNEKFDFVVVNLGENAGIRPGTNLGVYRNGKFLASLQVEKVHANMSAAKIPADSKNITLREGDEVVCPI